MYNIDTKKYLKEKKKLIWTIVSNLRKSRCTRKTLSRFPTRSKHTSTSFKTRAMKQYARQRKKEREKIQHNFTQSTYIKYTSRKKNFEILFRTNRYLIAKHKKRTKSKKNNKFAIEITRVMC